VVLGCSPLQAISKLAAGLVHVGPAGRGADRTWVAEAPRAVDHSASVKVFGKALPARAEHQSFGEQSVGAGEHLVAISQLHTEGPLRVAHHIGRIEVAAPSGVNAAQGGVTGAGTCAGLNQDVAVAVAVQAGARLRGKLNESWSTALAQVRQGAHRQPGAGIHTARGVAVKPLDVPLDALGLVA
jgi:hypothetical protein